MINVACSHNFDNIGEYIMSIDASVFNFDKMKESLGKDPFATATNKYAKDERFYTLTKDKDGNGAAIIRFMYDPEQSMVQEVYKINTTFVKNGKKRFVNVFSPTTIGLPCPFQEKWQELWNAGDKEGAKLFSRGRTYITNIKVLKDPKCPENEGKFFLFQMSSKMKDKIHSAMNPSQDDRELGATPKEMYNPIVGHSFKLACKKGANGQITYDPSEISNDVTNIYADAENPIEAAFNDIKENAYKLSEFTDPESYMSYDELKKKFNWVTFTDVETVSTPLTADVAQQTPQVAEVQPAQSTQSTQAVESSVQETAQTTEPAKPAQSQSLEDLLSGL